MKLTKDIFFQDFKIKKNTSNLKKVFNNLIKNKNEILKSLSTNYIYSFSKTFRKTHYKKFTPLRIIGIGGSILGSKAIYNFLDFKVKKKVYFIDNLTPKIENKKIKKKTLNIIISKSGNTLETISNVNILLKKNDNNIFITQNNKSYLRNLANKLKSEIIDHNNFIGGRFSVLSEVGMVPSILMGLNEKKFKQFDNLVKNKYFINSLISNVSNILFFIRKKKFNSIFINYDEKSEDFLKWYQQLLGESLGKKGKGIYPVISLMPKDNHSLMQLYLEGPKKNFFTFFSVSEKNSDKINNNRILDTYKFLKNKNLSEILRSQRKASEKVFINCKIPFRSFEVLQRSEKSLGELFTFFILETILLAKALKVNPYDQPSVELIKKKTKKILIKI